MISSENQMGAIGFPVKIKWGYWISSENQMGAIGFPVKIKWGLLDFQ
jgi:hypothetical protein